MSARRFAAVLSCLLLATVLLAAAGCGTDIPRLTKDLPFLGDHALYARYDIALLAEPQRAAPTVGRIKRGDQVVEEERNQFGWSKVRTASGQVGWVATSRLGAHQPSAAPAAPAAHKPTAVQEPAAPAQEPPPSTESEQPPAQDGKTGMFNSL